MLPLFLIVFIDLVGFGIIIPLLPFYGEHFSATPFGVGLIMATYSLTQFVAAPFWGRLSDRVGRRPVLLVTLAGSALSYLWLGYAETLWMLVAARAIGGAMAGNIGTAFAYVADVTTPENRARGMGAIGAAFGLGFILGPAIGGVLAGADPLNADYRTPALAAAALSGVALLMTFAILKESLAPEVRARMAAAPAQSRWALFRDALTKPQVALALLVSFLATLVFAGMETTFAMWSRRAHGWGPEQNGYLFAFVGLLGAIVQGGAIGALAKRFGEPALIIAGSAALAAGMVMVPLAPGLAGLLVAMAVIGFGFSILSPSLNSQISRQVGATEQGGVMGVARSTTTMARVVGPAWAGMIFSVMGKDWPFFAGAAVMLGVVVLAVGLRRRAASDRVINEKA